MRFISMFLIAAFAPVLFIPSTGIAGAGIFIGGGNVIQIDDVSSFDYQSEETDYQSCRFEWGMPAMLNDPIRDIVIKANFSSPYNDCRMDDFMNKAAAEIEPI